MADLFSDPPAIVRPAHEDAELMDRLKVNLAEQHGAERLTLEKRIAIGEDLITLKARRPHGEFLKALAELGLTARTAQKRMRDARDADQMRRAAHLEEALVRSSEDAEEESPAPPTAPAGMPPAKPPGSPPRPPGAAPPPGPPPRPSGPGRRPGSTPLPPGARPKPALTFWVKFDQKLGPLNRVIDDLGMKHARSPEFLQMKEHLDAILVLKANWHRRLGEIG